MATGTALASAVAHDKCMNRWVMRRRNAMSRSMEPTILTPGGRDRLEAELHHLKPARRAEVAELFAQTQTSASGDAELELERGAAREEMALVEGRIAQLEGLLANATVVEPAL